MEQNNQSNWAIQAQYGSFKIKRKTVLGGVVNTGAKVAGALALYGIGYVAGDVIEHVPELQKLVCQTVEYNSGLDIKGNIGKISGLVGSLYGAITSGVKLNENTLELEKIVVIPNPMKIEYSPTGFENQDNNSKQYEVV